MLGFFGKLFLGFLAVIAVLAFIGFLMKKRAGKDPSAQEEADEVFSEKVVSNVLDLNDQFNRARSMDNDGK